MPHVPTRVRTLTHMWRSMLTSSQISKLADAMRACWSGLALASKCGTGAARSQELGKLRLACLRDGVLEAG